MIVLNLRYVPEDNNLDCLGGEFSDSEIEARVRNTSILTDVYTQTVDELVYENQSSKEPISISILNK